MTIKARPTHSMPEAVDAFIEHLKGNPSARVAVFCETAEIKAHYLEEVLRVKSQDFAYVNRSVGEARHRGGGVVKFMTAEHPHAWAGPEWSLVWVILRAQTFTLLESLENMNLGLRLGDAPVALTSSSK
jgi:phage terminase large subunit-like protein